MTTPLPPTDPTAPDDKLPGEAELAALYRQLPRSEPGPALDAAVLQAAAQALAADEYPLAVERRRGPRERGDWVRPKDPLLRDLDAIGVEPRRRLPPWLLTLGSAASLVLVAGLAWHLHEQPAVSVPATPASTAPTTSAAADAGAVPAADRQAAGVAGTTAAAKAAPLPSPQAPMQARADTTAARAAVPAPTAQSMSRPSQITAQSSPVAPPAVAELPAQAVAPPPPALAGAPTPPAAPAPPAEAAPATAPMVFNAAAEAQGDSPAQDRELVAIRQLFAEHHDEEAQRRLEDFRRNHPQRELPEDLRVRLRQP